MVRPSPEELRAQAFALSKILSGFKVKLSSQQCLDVLARLTWNAPYEAVLAANAQTPSPESESFLKHWLAGAHKFSNFVATLDRDGVQAAAWNGQAMPQGLHWDGRKYLKAAGAAALAFSVQARRFVQREIELCPSVAKLSFRVEQSEPIVEETLALLRIQNLERQHDPSSPRVSGIDWNRSAEPMLVSG